MKKQTIKSLAFRKNTISLLSTVQQLKGGVNQSQTSCWCKQSECNCEPQDT